MNAPKTNSLFDGVLSSIQFRSFRLFKKQQQQQQKPNTKDEQSGIEHVRAHIKANIEKK